MMIEVAYSAASGAQAIIIVDLPIGSTVRDAIIASKITDFACFPEFSELKLEEKLEQTGIQKLADRLGIFGKKVTLEKELRTGDRVEIYRSLLKDPKVARRERAKKYPIKK